MADAGPRPAAGNVHYHYMDALRAAFMLTGVFVHAATLGDDTIFNGIRDVSGYFRMEGFFLISGFLTAMLVRKYGAGRTVRRRLLSLGVPFLATLALCNPVTLWLAYNFHNPDVSLPQYLRGDTVAEPVGFLVWHLHLWFLVTLLLFAVCTPAALAVLYRVSATPAFDWIARGRLRAMTAIIIFVAVNTVVGRAAYRVAVEPVLQSEHLDFLLKATVEHFPFYLTGLLLYLNDQRLLASFCRPAPLLVVVSGAGILAAEQGWVGALTSSTGNVVAQAVFGVALVSTFFAVARRLIPRQRPAMRYMADASYTVYLFHYLWIYIFATALSFGPDARWPQMLLVTVLTFGVTLAIHHFIILRVPLLRKIFNGKFSEGARNARGARDAKEVRGVKDVRQGRHRAGARPQHDRSHDRPIDHDYPLDRSRSRETETATLNHAGVRQQLPPSPRPTPRDVGGTGEVTVPLSRRTVSATVAGAGAMPERPRRAVQTEQTNQDRTLVLHYTKDPLGRP